MPEFDTSTHLLTDNDIDTLNKIRKRAGFNTIKFTIIGICAAFLLPLLPSRSYHSVPFFNVTNYWEFFPIYAILMGFFMILALVRYIFINKTIKNDLTNNTKLRVSTTIDSEINKLTQTELEVSIINLGRTKSDIEDLRYFVSTLKNGDHVVVEFTSSSKKLLNFIKR